MRKLIGLVSHVLNGLRFRLLLLVIVACAPLVVLTLRTAWQDRQRQVESWRQRSQRMMELARHEEEMLIGQTRQLLLAMAESSAVRSGNRAGCKKLLDELLASYPRYADLAVIKTNGEVLASAVPTLLGLSDADRRLCDRAFATADFAIGTFPAGRIKGDPTINFAYPVFDGSGQFEGIVLAALDLVWFSRSGSELPAQLIHWATWTEMDRNGTVLVRIPKAEAVGLELPEKSLLKTLSTAEPGVITALNAEGVPSVFAVAPMHSHFSPGEVITILGVPQQTLFAGADRALLRSLTWLGLACSLAVALGWIGSSFLIVRPVKALVASSARLASGDLTARTGLPHGRDELGRLTFTFDLMAQALEQRETERKRASHKFQALSQRFVEVQETERRHIARELHDEIGQSLTVAEMNLQAALQTPGAAALERRLEDSIQAVERVLEQVQDLSLSLRPSMLDDLGLEPALRWYTQRQASLAGLQAHFRADPLEHRVHGVIETECFRVAQEALTNVVRHAQASRVEVELRRREGRLHLSVRDDGIGFDVAASRDEAVRGASLGLLSMEERAAMVGGGLELISAPSQGSEVHAWFPLKWHLGEC